MIENFGWSAALEAQFAPLAAEGLVPARVIAQHRDRWTLATAHGEALAQVSGRFAFEAREGDFPVVGDWVGADASGQVISAIVPRRTLFRRRAAGGGGAQAVCANVDLALITQSLNEDLNPRRLERYLAATRDSGAHALVLLTKADLGGVEAAREALAPSLGATPAIAVSALTGEGMVDLEGYLTRGTCAALLGSSGVGKSTLLNRLLGRDEMTTAAVRAGDGKGRHTTRHREMFRLAGGGLLIDTPGMRELGLLGDEEVVDAGFADVTALIGQCRFGDCGHAGEPGCAVQAALTNGALDAARWRAYQKLQREIALEVRRADVGAQADERARWKSIHKNQRAKAKHRKRNSEWD